MSRAESRATKEQVMTAADSIHRIIIGLDPAIQMLALSHVAAAVITAHYPQHQRGGVMKDWQRLLDKQLAFYEAVAIRATVGRA
jgi:hypothetical protein